MAESIPAMPQGSRNGVPEVPYAWRARRYPWAQRVIAASLAQIPEPAHWRQVGYGIYEPVPEPTALEVAQRRYDRANANTGKARRCKARQQAQQRAAG